MSVSLANTTPSAISFARSSSAFSTMPLWTTAIRPAASVCGWALRSLGSPWVAQRVWAIPTLPGPGSSPIAARRSSTRPTAFVVRRALRWATAIPAESYPRYSRRASPSTRILDAGRVPTYPTMPHMRCPYP